VEKDSLLHFMQFLCYRNAVLLDLYSICHWFDEIWTVIGRERKGNHGESSNSDHVPQIQPSWY
jgi:hypothetical protein